MPEEQFGDYVARERDRLSAERKAVATQQRELQAKLSNIDREFQAIDAYEAAKTGKAPRQPRSDGTRRTTRRGSQREDVLRVIGEGNGLSRGEILDRMGLKGNKAGEGAVSNVLNALAKGNQVRREGGKYHPA
jgi:hypothetical protein